MNLNAMMSGKKVMPQGTRLVVYGDEYEIAEVRESNYLLKCLGEDEGERILSFDDCASLEYGGNLRVATVSMRASSGPLPLKKTTQHLFLTLGKDHQKRVEAREAIVLGFLEIARLGWVKRTDASIKREMNNIIAASKKYLNDEPAGGDAAKRTYGGEKTETIVEYSPRRIRDFVKHYESKGLDGLVDDWTNSGNRKERLDPEVELILTRNARQYLSQRRPTKRVIYQNICCDIHTANKRRAAGGCL